MTAGKAAFSALALAGAYHLWSRSGRSPRPAPPDLRLIEAVESGIDAGKGNLLGVQTYMLAGDYAGEDRFHAKLDGYLAAARERGWLNERTIAVFPEYIGTWLVAAGEKRRVYDADTLAEAMRPIVLANLPAFLGHLARARAEDAAKAAIFRMKAKRMAAIYHATFSRLAARYGITIVAGSIVLPDPAVWGGGVAPGEEPLYNVSIVYRPDGSPHDEPVRKAFPVPDELGFTTPGGVADLPVFETPAGRLGVLICADSWFPEPYEVLRRKGAELLAVPSYAYPENSWTKPWGGYMASVPSPADAAADGYHRLSEGEAWLRYALAGRMGASGARQGINVFLRGRLWDLGSDGHSVAVDEHGVTEVGHVEGAALLNHWLH